MIETDPDPSPSAIVVAVAPATAAVPSLRPGAASRLEELTETWIGRRRSAHTRTAYRRDLWQWLDWCTTAGRNPLGATVADVDAWIIWQRTYGNRGRTAAAESTIARRVSAIASWYAYLLVATIDDPVLLVSVNPAEHAARPDVDPDHSDTIGLSKNEADRLVEQAHADGATAYALILLLLLAGLRVGSALAAHIEDLGTDRAHHVLDITTKRGKRRRVPLPPALWAAIDAMLAQRGRPDTGPLFTTPAGQAIYELWVYRLIRRLARKAGIPAADKLSPHSLRHSAITELLNATDGDLRRAQIFADHADPRTTMRYDRDRHNLDKHGAYVLAGRYAASSEPQAIEDA
jgi:integrase/recombinase XerD